MANDKKVKKSIAEHQEDALYREIWEEVHAQKTYDFVKKHAKLLIGLAAFILLLAIGNQLLNHYKTENAKKDALAFESAMVTVADRQADSAQIMLKKLGNKSSSGMGDIAMYQSAMLYLEKGQKDAAMDQLQKLAKHGNTRDFTHLATIRLALLKADSMSGSALEKFLSPTLSRRSPFYYTSMMLVSAKYVSEDNNVKAEAWLKKIVNDDDAPKIISAHAETMLAGM